MNQWNKTLRWWTSRSITTKFSLAFAVLLLLMFLILTISISTLMITRRATEHSMFASTHIQHLVLEMDRRLEKSRRLERDFFLHYPRLGFSTAYEQYARPASEQMKQIRALKGELQNFIEKPEFSESWQEYAVSLRLYLSAVGRHATTIKEAVTLVSKLADERSGAQARLREHATQLLISLKAEDVPSLMDAFREMRLLEKDYLITRQRPFMQSAFNVAHGLEQDLEQSSGLDASQRTLALASIAAYRATAEEMLDLNVAIRSIFNEFDLQARAADPIADELITHAHEEIERIRSQVARTSRLVIIVLLIAAASGGGLAGILALTFNAGITRNIIKLSQIAGQFQAGQLDLRAGIKSHDELGQLAHAFNRMATRISTLVDGLEQQVTDRTAELTASNRQLQQMEAALRAHSEHLEDLVVERTAKLRAAQEQLLRREKLAILGQMSGSVGHELRNPLATISNAVYYLNMVLSDADDDVREYLEIIATQSRNAEKVISDLLDFARIKTLQKEHIGVLAVVELALEQMTIPEAIRLECDVPETLPGLTVDRRHFEQVLLNLLKNACDAMPDGGNLTIRANANDERISIAVSDNGCGIPEGTMKKLFDPLFTTKPTGIGLGLAISKHLIELNGGEIVVESREGEGSTFTLSFPIGEM